MDTPADKKLTPMLAQYRSIKSRYPDALILFRLGDFYEMFESDAKIGARELELALTGRSFAKGVRLPMAGVLDLPARRRSPARTAPGLQRYGAGVCHG